MKHTMESKINVVFSYLSHLSDLRLRAAIGADTTEVEEVGQL